MLLFCPTCSNALQITPLPPSHVTPDQERKGLAGTQRFQCRTCPYQMLLDTEYYERRPFHHERVEEVLGGADSWKNVDKTGGTSLSFPSPSFAFWIPRIC